LFYGGGACGAMAQFLPIAALLEMFLFEFRVIAQQQKPF
jgi:hypothetical protein